MLDLNYQKVCFKDNLKTTFYRSFKFKSNQTPIEDMTYGLLLFICIINTQDKNIMKIKGIKIRKMYEHIQTGKTHEPSCKTQYQSLCFKLYNFIVSKLTD